MKIGTRTLLFGVHQFLWHPFTVWRAWRWLYGERPKWWVCVAIFFHDVGYWGLPNLDGPEGKRHPEGGARIAARIVGWVYARILRKSSVKSIMAGFSTYLLSYGHSRELAKQEGREPSPLCWADKACVLFDPPWLYLLRARLSGELEEFKQNAEPLVGKVSDEKWLDWYRARVRSLLLNPGVGATAKAVEDLKHNRR